MRQETLRWPSSRRWMILVMVIVALAILGQVSFDAESGPPSLGLRAEVRQG